MGFILNMERHTLAREGVDNLFLDAFLTLGEALVLGEREATDSWGDAWTYFSYSHDGRRSEPAVGLAVVCS